MRWALPIVPLLLSTRQSQNDAAPVFRVYDDAGNVIETQEHPGDFKVW